MSLAWIRSSFRSRNIHRNALCMILVLPLLETSYYKKEQFKNFISLFAYNHMESGFITRVFEQTIRDKYVVLARVRHSQRENDPRLQFSNQTGVS